MFFQNQGFSYTGSSNHPNTHYFPVANTRSGIETNFDSKMSKTAHAVTKTYSLTPTRVVEQPKKITDIVDIKQLQPVLTPIQKSCEINKELMSPDITCERFIEIWQKKREDFNNINIATFWHRLTTNKEKSKWSISLDDPRLLSLKNHTLNILDTMESRHLSNIIWALAKFECEDDSFISSIKETVEKKLSDPNFFKGQEIAIITWSFAKLECKDNNFIQKLKEFIETKLDNPNFFNNQNLVNISWSFMMLNQAKQFPNFITSILSKIEKRFKERKQFSPEQQRQLVQVREILEVEAKNVEIPWSKEFHEELCKIKVEQISKPPKSSKLHKEIISYLEEVHMTYFQEHSLYTEEYEMGFFIDNALLSMSAKIAIEVCGPCHYYPKTNTLKPEFQIKKRLLQSAGWDVMVVPYFIWQELKNDQKSTYIYEELKKTIQSIPIIPRIYHPSPED